MNRTDTPQPTNVYVLFGRNAFTHNNAWLHHTKVNFALCDSENKAK